ncbi:ABC transporter substrate-binding protein, partial [Roseateles sp. GG27B]
MRGDAASPQQAITAVDQLVSNDKVDIFAGTYSSAIANAASDAAARYGKLFWEVNATSVDLTARGLPNFVRTGPDSINF